jgi:glycerol-3-phosphate dehydrogenase (NAD(P)+)
MTAVAVFGAGAWGTALANVCGRAGCDVSLWGRRADDMRAMQTSRENVQRLPGVKLHERVVCVSDLAEAARADVLLAVVPAQAFRDLAGALAAAKVRRGTPLIICAKGIEQSSGAFLSDVARATAPELTPGVLSGPSFAADVAAGSPTAVTLAFADPALGARLSQTLAAPGFRLYHSTDVRGVEIGGAAKNVLAIACGLAAGSELGASAGAALVARGFAEIRRYAEAFDANPETLMGLSGLGDVVLTCASAQSRNFAFGMRLGRGASLEQAKAGKLAEGAYTASVLVETARAKGVEMPIAEAVADILEGRLGVAEAARSLLARPLKSES